MCTLVDFVGCCYLDSHDKSRARDCNSWEQTPSTIYEFNTFFVGFYSHAVFAFVRSKIKIKKLLFWFSYNFWTFVHLICDYFTLLIWNIIYGATQQRNIFNLSKDQSDEPDSVSVSSLDHKNKEIYMIFFSLCIAVKSNCFHFESTSIINLMVWSIPYGD